MSDLQTRPDVNSLPPLPPLPTREFDLASMRSRMREEWEENRRLAEQQEQEGWEDRPGVTGAKSPMFMMMALAAALVATAPQGFAPSAGSVAPAPIVSSL